MICKWFLTYLYMKYLGAITHLPTIYNKFLVVERLDDFYPVHLDVRWSSLALIEFNHTAPSGRENSYGKCTL